MEPLEESRKRAISLFYTDQNARSIAIDLKTSVVSLRKWWIADFGKEAVQQRGVSRILTSNKRRGLPEGQIRLCKCGGVCRLDHYECKVCSSASFKDYCIRYPEKALAISARRRSRVLNVPFSITEEYIKSCIPVDGCCPITGEPFERGTGKAGPQSMTLDRTIPELGYIRGNVSIISHLANTIKSNCIDPSIFRRVAEYVEASNMGQPSVLKFISDAVSVRSYYLTSYYYAKRPERRMVSGARERAKGYGVPFAIVANDIRACFPKDGCCPITRLPFERGEGKCGPQSMSLDRIIPELGYVPGNIAVISHLANAIKQNCTDPEVFRRIADYLEEAQRPGLRKAG
jgi:hypothetical protein